MEKKISDSNEKLTSQDKPAFHRAKGNHHSLTTKEKKLAEQKSNKKINGAKAGK